MKKINYTFLSLLLSLFSISNLASAQSGYSENNSDKKLNVVVKSRPSSGRPHIPSHQRITAFYDKEVLIIEFLHAEGECFLVMIEENGNKATSFTFDSSLPQKIAVGELTIPCSFIILTGLKNEYVGEIFYADE